MKINPHKKVRKLADEHIVVEQGAGETDMTRVIALNKSAKLLYDKLAGREFELADVVAALLDEYEVDEATARQDAAEWAESMRKYGLLL